MILKIGLNTYNLSPSFMTLFKYRIEYGVSFFDNIFEKDTLIKLMYISIVSEKPYFHIFKNQCEADTSFDISASHFYKELLIKDRPKQSNVNEGSNKIDEFEIMALAIAAHIPEYLLNTLNIFQLTKIINKYCDLKSGKQKAHEMSSNERKALYNISPEKEEEIEQYILENGGEVNG